MIPAGTRKRGIVTFELSGDSENVHAFSGNERSYGQVASTLGMTVYDDPSKLKIPQGKTLIKRTKAQMVKNGTAIVMSAVIQKGSRQSITDIVIPADQLENVMVQKVLNGKNFAGGSIISVRGKVQRVVAV